MEFDTYILPQEYSHSYSALLHHSLWKHMITTNISRIKRNDAWNDCECSSISCDADENVKLKYIKSAGKDEAKEISFPHIQTLKVLFKLH